MHMKSQSIMDRLSGYITTAQDRALPVPVSEKAKNHILDTIAAMVSGSRLKTGELAIKFIKTQGGTAECMVVGSNFLTTAINAAMVNGCLAHADETDDSHAPSFTHPGCAIVPAALAMAERDNASGEAFLRAVVLGYDVSSRIARVMSLESNRLQGFSTHAIGPLFGATAAAASLAKLNMHQIRHALAYTGQQASGITSWARDEEHVEKAFVFGGMGARNGVTSVLFAQNGFTGEDDIFSGSNNFLDLFCPAKNELPKWIDNLGSHYEISIANIKKFSVGSPIQAAAEAMIILVSKYGLTADKVKEIDVHLPPHGALIVNNRSMPDVNCQYIISVILLDGSLTFKESKSYERMSDPKVREVQSHVNLISDPQFADKEQFRPSLVRIHLKDGRILEECVPAVRGTFENPMTQSEVEAKSIDLLQDVLGTGRARKLINLVWDLDRLKSLQELCHLLSA
jgi:2-methylcitrate dehydratase PrpD